MLPPRPSFLPARPQGILEPAEPPAALVPLFDPLPQAGPSSSSSTTCLICAEPAKYTCPRCSTRTCSLPCSKLHKEQMECDGKRDPTKFVTLNSFGQGDWGGDYAYLESGRRRIADWGKDLPPSHAHVNGNGRGGGGRRGGGGGRGLPKVEGLRRELERRGIEVEFMAEGMGRRKMNQSSWNPKNQTLHLTIQLSIPPKLLDPESTSTDPRITTHLRVPLVSPSPSPTLASLLPEQLRSIYSDLTLVLPFHPSLANPTPIDILLRKPRPRLFFPPLAMDRPLSEDVFKDMSWVEFPVVHVFSTAEWETALEGGQVAVVPVSSPAGQKRKMEDEQPESHSVDAGEAGLAVAEGSKRVKVSNESGVGLLALNGYESEEDDAVEEVVDDADEEVTEADLKVLHALGTAAALDMG